jgi:PTS system glucitol/sorbitol-specific IIA component
VRYSTVVTRVGPLVKDFVTEGRLVLFAEGAPEELHDFSVLHAPDEGFEEVRVGDSLIIGAATFRVTALGEVANKNLEAIGHAVFKANGNVEPDMPGDICVEARALPLPRPGQKIVVEEGR